MVEISNGATFQCYFSKAESFDGIFLKSGSLNGMDLIFPNRDGALPALPTSPREHEGGRHGGERDTAMVLSQKKEIQHVDDKAEQKIELRADVLGMILMKLPPRALARVVGSNWRFLQAASSICKPETVSPFLGAIVQRDCRQSCDLVTFERLPWQIKESVKYVRASLKILPKGAQILDCRYGYILLNIEDSIRLWNPFRRRLWIPLPEYKREADKLIGAAIVREDNSGMFTLVLLCLGTCHNECEWPLVVNVFSSKRKGWQRLVTTITFKEKESVHTHVVVLGGKAYFLSHERREILKVNPSLMTTDSFMIPKDAAAPMSLANIKGELCLATRGNRCVPIFTYSINGWKILSKHQTTQQCYWTKPIGSADENGLIVVDSGSGQSHILNVQDGSWKILQEHSSSKDQKWFPVEMRSPFQYPFPPAVLNIEESWFEDIDRGAS